MDTNQQRLATFIELYQKEYGITLTPQRAEEEFSKLLQLYKLVYLPFQSNIKKEEKQL